MRKHFKSVQLVLRAKLDELIDAIFDGPFSPEEEVALVQRGLLEPLQVYIEEYGLSLKAAIELFKLNNWALAQALLAWIASNPGIMKAFLDYAPYEMVKEHVDKFYVPELPEQDALERFDSNELRRLLATGISRFAQCDILMRGDDALVKEVITLGNLAPREAKIARMYASHENLMFWYKNEKDEHVRYLIGQYILIRFDSEVVQRDCLERFPLDREVELFFFKVAPLGILIPYVLQYNPAGGDVAILKYQYREKSDSEKIVQFLIENQLTIQGEAYLILHGRRLYRETYIKARAFSPENEALFIKKRNHREIMIYLSVRSLSKEGQIALIERGKLMEIGYLIANYPLCNAAFRALFANSELADIFGEAALENTKYSII